MTNQQIFGWLRGDTPNVQGQEFPLKQREVIIGRGTQSDVQLTDPKISRKHARLRFGEDKVLLEDLGSASGTLVNGERDDIFVISDGDVIAMGDTLLVFRSSPDAVSTIMTPSYASLVDLPPSVQSQDSGLRIPVTPQAADAGRRSPIFLFLLGLLPVLLIGAVAIVLIWVLGGESDVYQPPNPARDQVVAAPTEVGVTPTLELEPPVVVSESTSTGSEETLPNAEPMLSVRPKDPEVDSLLRTLEELSTPSEMEGQGDTMHYEAEIPYGEEFQIAYYQCAVDKPTLIDNLAVTKVDFRIDEFVIPIDELALTEWERNERYCYSFEGVVGGLSVGSHEIENRFEQLEAVNDGFETYPPGSFSTLYHVEIVTQPSAAESTPEIVLPEGPRVTLHVGDARFFTETPEVIAYANTEDSTPPPELTITDNCGSGCWRYNQWIAIADPGQYIEAESTVATSAIGVQLWGDDNDGWVRVSVDGEEVWTGEMRGADNQWPGGAFVRYLEIAGLESSPHTLRFEPTGQGGSVTIYFFGIGEVTP